MNGHIWFLVVESRTEGEAEGKRKMKDIWESAEELLDNRVQLIADWESWDSDDDTDDPSDVDKEEKFVDCHSHTVPTQTQQEGEGENCEGIDEGKRIIWEEGEGLPRDEERESKVYLYLNTIPILGSLYGLARFVFYQQCDNSSQMTTSLWGISKNLLNTLTLTAGALLVPLNVPDLIAAAVATGILEGIVDTLLDYYQNSKNEREEMSVEEIVYNVLNHAPIIGILYDIPRLFYFLKEKDKDEVKKSLWGLAANSVTTAITITSVIKFSLKATGSIPSGMARSAQSKVTFTLAKKGVTAPVVQAGKVLASKEVRRLKKRIKRELSELKTKIKDVETEKFLRGLGLGSDLSLDQNDCRFHLRKRLKSFIDSKKSKFLKKD